MLILRGRGKHSLILYTEQSQKGGMGSLKIQLRIGLKLLLFYGIRKVSKKKKKTDSISDVNNTKSYYIILKLHSEFTFQ